MLSLFNAVPIEVIFDKKNQPWFKRAHVGTYLEIKHIITSIKGLDTAEMRTRSTFGTTYRTTVGWSGPKDQQNKTDVFLSFHGVMHVIVNSRKLKGKELRDWMIYQVIPRGLNKLLEEKQQAISDRDNTIEEKDAALALLNDDLTDRERDIVILEQENLVLEARVEDLEGRSVPILKDSDKNNGMVIIQKNNNDPYPYIAICGQQGYVAQKIKNKLTDYPNGQLVVLAETSNAIVHYNWLRERRCIVANPERVRHFRLGDNYTHQRLMELQES